MITDPKQRPLIICQEQQKGCLSTTQALVQDESEGNPVLERVLSDLRTAQHEFGDSDCAVVAEAWNALGLARVHTQRDAVGAYACHQEALRIYSKTAQHEEIAVVLNDLGYCEELLGNHTKALELYQEALRILSGLNVDENHHRMIATRRALSRIRRE